MKTLKILESEGVQIAAGITSQIDAGNVCVADIDCSHFDAPTALLVKAFRNLADADSFILAKAEASDCPVALIVISQ